MAAAAPPSGTPLLQLFEVHKRYGGVRANDGVDLQVHEGAIVGLIGPNGSGKSTLFDAVTGHVPLDSGRVVFGGRDITGLDAGATARLGLLRTFQHAGIYAGLTCLQCLLASRRRAGEPLMRMLRRADRGDSDTRTARELLDFVGLAAASERPAGELSYGQRKLLELAMALMNRPRMLMLDEPMAGVSPALIPLLMDRLRDANTGWGITLLIVEHNMQVVMGLAQQVYCLAQGRVLACGTPEQVRDDPRVLEAYLGAR